MLSGRKCPVLFAIDSTHYAFQYTCYLCVFCDGVVVTNVWIPLACFTAIITIMIKTII